MHGKDRNKERDALEKRDRGTGKKKERYRERESPRKEKDRREDRKRYRAKIGKEKNRAEKREIQGLEKRDIGVGKKKRERDVQCLTRETPDILYNPW